VKPISTQPTPTCVVEGFRPKVLALLYETHATSLDNEQGFASREGAGQGAEDLAGHRRTFSQTIADVAPEDWGGTSRSNLTSLSRV